MGAAEAVPGISGGTAAMLSGVYAELIRSLRSIDRQSFRLLSKKDFAGFWKYINGNFLITLLAGTITGVVALSRLVIAGLNITRFPRVRFFLA